MPSTTFDPTLKCQFVFRLPAKSPRHVDGHLPRIGDDSRPRDAQERRHQDAQNRCDYDDGYRKVINVNKYLYLHLIIIN